MYYDYTIECRIFNVEEKLKGLIHVHLTYKFSIRLVNFNFLHTLYYGAFTTCYLCSGFIRKTCVCTHYMYYQFVMHVDVNVLDHQWNLVYNSTDTCTGIQFVLIIINFRGW